MNEPIIETIDLVPTPSIPTKPAPLVLNPKGLKVDRVFSTEGVHPFDEKEWDMRTAEISDAEGKTIFKQENIEAPKDWSQLAVKIAASKYFHGDIRNGTDPYKEGRESSIKHLITRVCKTITSMGKADNYFQTEEDAGIFEAELTWLCVNQYGAFNSPVWFNMGVYHEYKFGNLSSKGNFVYERNSWSPAFHGKAFRAPTQYEYPQSSACFLNSVEDSMESIMALATAEAMLFKFGSGTGTNLSTLRSSREFLSGGGRPSGPLSFLRMYDAVAGTVKSGGRCLAGNQLVWTVNGLRSVKELAESGVSFTCLSYDPPTKQIKVKPARARADGTKTVVRVTTDKGHFELSADHSMRLSSHGYCLAGALQLGMSLHAGSVDLFVGKYLRVHLQDGKKGKGLVHRMVAFDIMKKEIRRLHVHHKDENTLNNSPENLEPKTASDHAYDHGKAIADRGEHIFQRQHFSHAGAENGMHANAAFWNDPEKVKAYKETQKRILKESGRAADMQKEASRHRRCNNAFKIINAGYPIHTFELYYEGYKKAIGPVGNSKANLRAAIDEAFGSFNDFVKAVAALNHRVCKIEHIGIHQVFNVEVDCPTADDKSPESGHNFMIFPIDSTSAVGRGIFVSSSRWDAKPDCVEDSRNE